MRIATVLVMLLTGPAAAAPPTGSTPSDDDAPVFTDVALAINAPIRWVDGGSFAASGYFGFATHHAIRANFSFYEHSGANVIADFAAVAAGGGDEASYRGDTKDVGIAWMYFPRRLWSGPSFEAGMLVRAQNLGVENDSAASAPENVETKTTGIAGRALVGWSWLGFDDRAFISIAVGVSAGRYTGTETSWDSYEPMRMTEDIDRWKLAAEGFMRFGVAIGP